MADLPPVATALDPSLKNSEQPPSAPRPLGPNTFTGMVDTSEEAVENRYRYNAVSSQGGTNAIGGTKLFDDRLKANIELNRDPEGGYNAWNKRRQEAIDRGEDPNSELLAKIEARPPDSYLERVWRKLMGKKKTKKEEREAKEAREREKIRGKELIQQPDDCEASALYAGLTNKEKNDGVISRRLQHGVAYADQNALEVRYVATSENQGLDLSPKHPPSAPQIASTIRNIRSPSDFDSLTLLHASNRRALITLWTASWCPSCKTVTPLIRDMIEREGAGENKGGVGFAEVEFDSPTLGEVAGRYMITSIPTLLAFSRGEAQLQTRLTSVNEMKDRDFVRLWIEDEAMRGESGGKGGGGGLFGGSFGLGER